MDSKKKLLVFPFGYLSHYLRCIVVARHLQPYFDISFAHQDEFLPFIQQAGFTTFQCKTLDEKEVLKKAGQFDFSWLNEPDLEKVFVDQLRCIHTLRPDVVLGDAVPTLAMAAEKTKTPYISLMNGYMSKYYNGHRSLPERHSLSAFLKKLPAFVSGCLVQIGEKKVFRNIERPFQHIRAKYGLSRKRTYLDEMEGDQNLICDLPELFPQAELPQNYSTIGPLIYDDYWHNNLPATDRSKKTILISMGSTGNWQAAAHFNHPCFSRYNIIASGDKYSVLTAPHIIKAPFISAKAVLPFTDLVICHGGNGTLYQALSYGVPLLCMPCHFEQEWNITALEKKQLAKKLNNYNDASELLGIVEAQLHSKPEKLLQEMKNKIDGAVAALDQKMARLVTAVNLYIT